ncbi:serine hydrolase domain-containing protein [Actinophytocola xanthii]|uniref:Beta-lactamase-related domain-containing protein n=1 Tax=Actinophytocola xanthii TaxID=1912961 RepID=A0A1Q8CVW0_9PSEU|nr:serine hydrolase domain-containing protein [Actinophytocola xanthii]OLF18493.1 hypothetical protein BU204_05925 [Actinophytocola xanthii]
MFTRYLGVALVLGALLLAGVPAQASTTRTDVEAFLVERMRDIESPGLSYALVQRDRVVRSGAWGTDGFGRPMTPHTPVGFGSVSKPVTATGVLRLVDAGVVGLDDPVVRHLPWFRLADQRAADRITVRHLLEQTSGISARDGYDRSDVDDNAPGATRRWVESLAEVTPTAAPGERHQYSPANAVVLAALVEETTGLSLPTYLRREVFTPLDMADTIADARDAERMPPGHEFYFGTVRDAERTFDTSGLAYGYLGGSVTDLAHLAVPLLTDGRYGGGRFLSERLVDALRRGGPPAAGGHYPLGWRTGTLRQTDTPIVWHAGGAPGYHSILITAPTAGWAIAVQQNVYSPLHDAALNSAAFGALAITLGGAPDPLPEDPTETAALVGLVALTLALAAGLAWQLRRLVRRQPAPARRARARTALSTAAWCGLGIVSALAVWLWLPGSFDLRLRHILRFMPDIGQLAVTVLVIGPALTAARLAVLLAETRRQGAARRAGV